MSVTKPHPDAVADYVIECSEKELEALTEVVKEADGRKNETKLAEKALGLR